MKFSFGLLCIVCILSVLSAVSASASGELSFVDKTPYMKEKYKINASTNTILLASGSVRAASEQNIGDVTLFWVEDTGKWAQINATLVNKTNDTYVYVQMLDSVGNAVWQNATPASGKARGYITQQDANQILNEFSQKIYPKEREIFGNETYAGPDNDTHVTILLMDIDSDYANNKSPEDVFCAGYFDQMDMGNNSNKRKMIYIDTYPLIETGSGYGELYNRTPDTNHSNSQYDIDGINNSYPTIAHEFNHMIQFKYDPYEETWVDEGFSEYAPSILGYGHSEWVDEFKDEPYLGLTKWHEDYPSHYGASYMWMLYLSEHYGGNQTIRNILQNNKTGIAGINQVLAPNATFEQVFHNWTLANYMDNTSVNPLYGYESINFSVRPRANKTSYPANGSSWLELWGADYINFTKGLNGTLNITFRGDSSNFSVSVIYYNGSSVSVENMSLTGSQGSNRINRFKSTDSVVLVVMCTANTSGDVTYNYSADANLNSPPQLNNSNVTPASGDTNTIFNFTVRYADANNDAPVYVNATIDGVAHAMNAQSADYLSGVTYYYATNLSNGTHKYNFSASDGYNSSRTSTFNLTVNKAVTLPNATEFGTEYGTTNFSAVNITDVTNMTLATAHGRIQFPPSYSVNADGQNYDAYVEIGEGFISVNSSALNPTFNSTANLTLNNVTCPSVVYFAPDTFTSKEQIVNGGTICNDSTNPSCTKVNCTGTTLTFTTNHFTSFAAAELVNVTLNKGWNIVSFPLNRTYTAEGFMEGTPCTIISKYEGGIQTHVKGSSFFDFNVTPGRGYYTYCPDNETKMITGTPISNISIPLAPGWNLIGSVPAAITNASVLCTNTSCTAAAKYENSGFKIYPKDDFNITGSRGYFVYLTEPVNWTINN